MRNQGNENQPIKNGPIRLSIPKSETTTAKIVTNDKTRYVLSSGPWVQPVDGNIQYAAYFI